jgi:hypothetical protein
MPYGSDRDTTRDTLLRWAAGTFAAGATLGAIGYALRFVGALEFDRKAELQVAVGFRLIGSALLIPAFAGASTAFALDAKARAALLGKSALIAATAYAAFAVSEVTILTAQRLPAKFVAVYVLGAVGSLALVVAACFTSVAFIGSTKATTAVDRVVRDRLLGRANISVAVAALLLVIGALYRLEVDRLVRGISNAGVIVVAFGDGVFIVAGIIAAVAFLTSGERQQRGLAWMPRRDRALGLSTMAFAVAYLTIAVGFAMQASAWSGFGLGWKPLTAIWISVAANAVFTVAAVVACSGFWRSRGSFRPADSLSQ